jgi:malonyl-ACP decarboxylase
MKKVVVTGMGVVSSIGTSIDKFDWSLRNGVSGINEYEVQVDEDTKKVPMARVQQITIEDIFRYYKENEQKNISRILHRVSTPIINAVASAAEALAMAGLLENNKELEDTGIIIGGTNICMDEQLQTIKNNMDNQAFVSPTHAMKFMDSDHIGVLSEIFKIHGEGAVVGAASASGNVAVIQAARLIAHGEIDKCVVVGAMSQLSVYEIIAFENCGAMAVLNDYKAEEICRPFDCQHNGFVYGEGTGCLVIESEESAVRRSATILAEIAGWGVFLDGNRYTDPNIEGEIKSMRKALDVAGISGTEIDYINAHGSSSALGDETELKAISQVMRDRNSPLYVNSSKSYYGHCVNSCAVLEIISAICQLRGDYIHANLNLKYPIKGNYILPNKCVHGVKINNILKNSFGFGGINTSIVLKRMCER